MRQTWRQQSSYNQNQTSTSRVAMWKCYARWQPDWSQIPRSCQSAKHELNLINVVGVSSFRTQWEVGIRKCNRNDFAGVNGFASNLVSRRLVGGIDFGRNNSLSQYVSLLACGRVRYWKSWAWANQLIICASRRNQDNRRLSPPVTRLLFRSTFGHLWRMPEIREWDVRTTG